MLILHPHKRGAEMKKLRRRNSIELYPPLIWAKSKSASRGATMLCASENLEQSWADVRMHHYSYIRKDLKKKFNNSSHSGIRNYTKDNVTSYESYERVDYFNLDKLMETWDKE